MNTTKQYYPRRVYSVLHVEFLYVEIQPNMKRVWNLLSEMGEVYCIEEKARTLKLTPERRQTSSRKHLKTYSTFYKCLREYENNLCVEVRRKEGREVVGIYFIEQQLIL